MVFSIITAVEILAISAQFVSNGLQSPSLAESRRVLDAPCLTATDEGVRGTLSWWEGVMSSTRNLAYRRATNLPLKAQLPVIVSDSVVCANLKRRVDSIAIAADANYATLHLRRSILVLSLDSVLLAADPQHPQAGRQMLYHVFSPSGKFLSKHYAY